MQAPMPPPSAASPYQPPAASLTKRSIYSFQKWLMIGAALLVFATIFAQFPLSSSEPDMSDYDMFDEKEEQQYNDAVDSFEGQVALFGAMATILQVSALTMLGYAFFREAQEDDGQHVAVRITMILAGIVLVTSIVGRSFSLF